MGRCIRESLKYYWVSKGSITSHDRPLTESILSTCCARSDVLFMLERYMDRSGFPAMVWCKYSTEEHMRTNTKRWLRPSDIWFSIAATWEANFENVPESTSNSTTFLMLLRLSAMQTHWKAVGSCAELMTQRNFSRDCLQIHCCFTFTLKWDWIKWTCFRETCSNAFQFREFFENVRKTGQDDDYRIVTRL